MSFTRREYLKFAASIAMTAITPSAAAVLRARAASRSRIDTHHHVFPPPYIAALAAGKQEAGIAKAWTVARTLDDMERAGVETSILSVTQPAVTFAPPDVARRVARQSNEWVAKLVGDTRGRFGSFAMMPLPDVDGTLRETEYALDTLKADGVCLLTSYGDRWLGHASFAPVLDELNRRKAVVYTHPATADCCRWNAAVSHRAAGPPAGAEPGGPSIATTPYGCCRASVESGFSRTLRALQRLIRAQRSSTDALVSLS